MSTKKGDSPRFFAFVSMTIAWETGGDKSGGYTKDPKDLGGETKWGISKRSHPALNIKGLTFLDAVNIYKNEYWNDKYDYITDTALAFKLFDMGVLKGPNSAIKVAQKAIKKCGKTIKVDGVFGNITLAALNDCDATILYNTYIEMLKGNFVLITLLRPSQKKYLKGWLRRLTYKWSTNEA